MEKVSIVVPVYNAKKYIKRTVKSLLNQTYGNINVILVDDGSTDGSGDICDRFAKKDPRVTVIHKKNGGAYAARKDGIMACKDDGYIMFSDADDVLNKNAVRLLMDSVGESDVCIGRLGSVWRSIRFDDKASKADTAPYVMSHEEFMDKRYCSWFGITDIPVSLCAKLYRVDIIKNACGKIVGNPGYMGEDQLVTLHAMPLAKSITMIPHTVYYYRPCGGTRKYVANLYDAWKELYFHRAGLIEEQELPSWYKTLLDIELCNMVFSCFFNYLKKKDADDDGLRKEIDRLCALEEVKAAASNPKIEISKFPKVQLIKAGDKDGIFEYVRRESTKAPLKRLVKKFAVKFA